jgi:Xaa-Pro aminopeptidase
VEQDSAVLFIDEAQVDDAVKAHLGQEVLAKPYREILSYIRALIERGSMRKVQVSPIRPMIYT